MVVDQTWMIVVIDGCGWCLKRLPWTMGLAGGRHGPSQMSMSVANCRSWFIIVCNAWYCGRQVHGRRRIELGRRGLRGWHGRCGGARRFLINSTARSITRQEFALGSALQFCPRYKHVSEIPLVQGKYKVAIISRIQFIFFQRNTQQSFIVGAQGK